MAGTITPRQAKQEARAAWAMVSLAKMGETPITEMGRLIRKAQEASDRMHEVCGTINPRMEYPMSDEVWTR